MRSSPELVASTAAAASVAVVLAASAIGAVTTEERTLFDCPVSRPTAHPRPYFDFGNKRIAVNLPPHATFVAVRDGKPGGAWVQADGWIRTKVGWWAAATAPVVTGRRLDRPARPLRADVGVLSYAVPGGPFYPSLLFFPSVGCWRITATSGHARLVAVVRVSRA